MFVTFASPHDGMLANEAGRTREACGLARIAKEPAGRAAYGAPVSGTVTGNGRSSRPIVANAEA